MRQPRFAIQFVLMILLALTTASKAAGQGKIVFSQGAASNELWVVNDDGSNPRKLLTMPSYIVTSRWSRDGGRIAFQSSTDLWIVNEDGTNLHSLPGVHVADGGLTWDSTGTGFVYARVCVCCEHLGAVNEDGSNDRVFWAPGSGVTFFPDAREGDATPSSRVAYFRFRCGGGTSQFFGNEITREGGLDFFQVPGLPDVNLQQFPRWSPDGNLLATAIRIAATGETGIEILDPFNSSAPRNRLLLGAGNFCAPDFGCGADRLFFAREDDGFQNIRRVKSDGSGQVTVTGFSAGVIRDLDFFCTQISVDIDIKPGSFPNSINLGSHGNVPVAILSTAAFDAARVEPLTVTLAGASVALKGKDTPMASLVDVNGDGLLDLVVHVSTEALQLSAGDTTAVVEGSTRDGFTIKGSDSVRIVP